MPKVKGLGDVELYYERNRQGGFPVISVTSSPVTSFSGEQRTAHFAGASYSRAHLINYRGLCAVDVTGPIRPAYSQGRFLISGTNALI